MKNALVITSLVVIISYPIAIVAKQSASVRSASAAFPRSPDSATTAGILAFAFTDYFRQPRFRAPAVSEPKPQIDNRSAAHHLTLTSASVRTN